MAIRLSGINSGLDTDAIVQELVSAYSLKTQKYEKAQTKLTWKQDIWKNLNTKIYGLYTNISNLRFSGAYSLKKVSVSDNTKATVSASSTAPSGTQKLNIEQIAQSCYMTGGEIKLSNGSIVTGATKLSELGYNGGEAKIEIKKLDGTTSKIEIRKTTSVSDFITSLQECGLNASFDDANQRIFVSSKKSGADETFFLIGQTKDGADALKLLGLDTALVDENGEFTKIGKEYYGDDYDIFAAAKLENYTGVGGLQEYVEKLVEEYDNLEAQKRACEAKDAVNDVLEALDIRPSISDLKKVVNDTTGDETAKKTALQTELPGANSATIDALYDNIVKLSKYESASGTINTIFEDFRTSERPTVSELQNKITDALEEGKSEATAKTELGAYLEELSGKKITSADLDGLYSALTELKADNITEITVADTRNNISETLDEVITLTDLQDVGRSQAELEKYLVDLAEPDISEEDAKKYSASLMEYLTVIDNYENPANITEVYDKIITQLNDLFTGDTKRPTVEELQNELAGVSADKQLETLTSYLNSKGVDVENNDVKTEINNLLSSLNAISDFAPSNVREAYDTLDKALNSGLAGGIDSIDDLRGSLTGDEDAQIAQLEEMIPADSDLDAEALYNALQTVADYEGSSKNPVESLNRNDILSKMNSSKVADIAQINNLSELNREIYMQAVAAYDANRILTSGDYTTGAASTVYGQDAVIYLNDVKYQNSTNSFNINGLSIEATGVTGSGDDKAITITTSTDTQGIYDKIKDFLIEYNNVINEMCKLYNAEYNSDYEPLTDEEKEAMSDEQIEKWETKIKDSLLRRDTTLNSVMSAMINSMAQTFEVGGQKLSLSTFGIHTLGFLNAAENENYAFHIDGDEEDENTSGNEEKLMKAIQENPDQIVEFMTKVTTSLYTAIDNKMKTTELSSAYKVYNDKEMDKELANYASTISKWEERVKEKEDYYYNKFAQMETALAKLQSQTSSISGLLGQ